MEVDQREISPDSLVGIAERYNTLCDNPPKGVRKNNKIYKMYEKELDDLRLEYNKKAGFLALDLTDTKNIEEWKIFVKNKKKKKK